MVTNILVDIVNLIQTCLIKQMHEKILSIYDFIECKLDIYYIHKDFCKNMNANVIVIC